MSEKVKLIVCNEPQNCETVKELEQRLKEVKDDAEKWRFLHLEAEEPLSCQMCRNAHDAVLRKLDSTKSHLRAASEILERMCVKCEYTEYTCICPMKRAKLEAALRGEVKKQSILVSKGDYKNE